MFNYATYEVAGKYTMDRH